MQLSSFAPEIREILDNLVRRVSSSFTWSGRGKRREPGNEVEVLSRITYLERVTSNDQS